MKLVFIPDGGTDIRNGKRGQFQKFRRLYHPVMHQKFLRRASHRVAEDLAEITPVDAAYRGDLLYGYIVLEILLDEIDRFFYIIVAHLTAVHRRGPLGGAGEVIQKKIKMPHQMHRGFFGVMDNIVHLLHQHFPQFFGMGMVYRRIQRKFRQIKRFLHPQAVKLDPHILPGKTVIGKISIDLPGKDQKTLAALNGEGLRLSFGIVRHQRAGAGEDIMKKIMVSGKRTKGVAGIALLITMLIHIQIDEILAGEYIKENIAHKGSPFAVISVNPQCHSENLRFSSCRAFAWTM